GAAASDEAVRTSAAGMPVEVTPAAVEPAAPLNHAVPKEEAQSEVQRGVTAGELGDAIVESHEPPVAADPHQAEPAQEAQAQSRHDETRTPAPEAEAVAQAPSAPVERALAEISSPVAETPVVRTAPHADAPVQNPD